jgi:hypothetical protein
MSSPLSPTMSAVVIEQDGSAQRKPSVNTVAAVERVPVEVWHKILRIAISCPLIPRDDDNYFQRRDVENFGCAKIYQYVKAEQIRMKLRLVCHSWDAFLNEYSDRLVHLSSVIPGGHWPPVKSWDRVIRLVGPKSLTCKCVDLCPLTERMKQSIHRRRDDAPSANGSIEDRIRGEYLPMIGNHCRVIIWPYTWKNDLLDRERFGSVTMLIEELKDPMIQLPIISATYPGLTHLNVTLRSQFDPLLILHLPRLTSLTLCVKNTGLAIFEGPAIVGRWLLPKLRHMAFVGPFPEEAIYYLLDQVGLNVTEFHSQDESPEWIRKLSRIWSLLPSVSIFGASCLQILSVIPPVEPHNRPINLIMHFSAGQTHFMPEEASLILFQQDWASSIVGAVTIDIAWNEWISNFTRSSWWFSASALSAQIRMFDVLNGMGNGLRDSEGVPFGSTIKAQLSAAVEQLRHSPGLGMDPMVCTLSVAC